MMSQKEIQDSEGNVLPVQGVSKDESSLIVRLQNGTLALVPIHLLNPRDQDRYFLPMNFDELEPHLETRVIPVIEEQPLIQKKKVATESVKIRKTIHETPKVIEELLAREEIHVDRVERNDILEEPAQMRTEGNVTIIPVQEEILVVQKKILLREEIRITKERVEHNEKVTLTLKSEEVTIDRKKIN